MANDIKKNNKDKEKVMMWFKLSYWFIVVFGVTFIISTAVNIGIKASTAVEEEEKSNDDKKVSEEIVDKLLQLNGVYYGDELTQLILYNTDGVLNDKLDANEKSLLVYYYAKNHDILVDITQDINGYCSIEAPCKGIAYSDFVIIEKYYGITNDPIILFEKERMYNGYYLYKNVSVETDSVISQTDFQAEYFGNDIILSGDLSVKNLETSEVETKKITYTFKLNKDNEYYLYSVTNK